MDSRLDRRGERPLTSSRVLDDVCQHPVITGVAVVSVALALGALLHYGPPVQTRSRGSLFDRIRRALRSITN